MTPVLEAIARFRSLPAFAPLIDLPVWIVSGGTTKEGKPDKSPKDYRAPWKHGKSNDPATWGTLAQIEEAARKYPHHVHHCGIISGPHAQVLDWDYKPHASTPDIVERQAALFPSYQETSLSGRGRRCLILAPGLEFKKVAFELEPGVELEVFNSHQYAILTGNTINPAPIADCTDTLTALLTDLTPPPAPAPERVSTPRSAYTGDEVAPWEAAARTWSLPEMLIRNGYARKGTDRHLYPGSSTGLAGVHLFVDQHGRQRCYSHHSSDPLNTGHALDVFDVFTLLEHGGDVKAATRAARDLLGLESPAVKRDTLTEAKALWAEHAEGVLTEMGNVLERMPIHHHTRNAVWEVLAYVYERALEGQIEQRGTDFVVMVGGLKGLKAAGLGGRLTDISNRLKWAGDQGLLGRVERIDPASPYAPLAIRIPSDPRDLPGLRYQEGLHVSPPISLNAREAKAKRTSHTEIPATHTPVPSEVSPGVCVTPKPAPLTPVLRFLLARDRGLTPELPAWVVTRLEAHGYTHTDTYTHIREELRSRREADEGHRAKYQAALERQATQMSHVLRLARFGGPEAQRHARVCRAILHRTQSRLSRLWDGESISEVAA